MTDQPYASSAALYLAGGWPGVLPLPARSKTPPPAGFTGGGPDPTAVDVLGWVQNQPGSNVALRLPANVIGIDVDAYDGKAGAESLAAAVEKWGPLPATWISTSRDDGLSGIRFFRVPEGLAWPNTIGPGIETVRRGHRYAVVWPSIHPSGATYLWLGQDGTPSNPPTATQLPELPDAWIEGLTNGALDTGPTKKIVVTVEDGYEAARSYLTPGNCSQVVNRLKAAEEALEGPAGSRHDQTRDAILKILSMGQRGHGAVGWAMNQLEGLFIPVIAAERGGAAANTEWRRMYEGAVEVLLADPGEPEACFGDRCDSWSPEAFQFDPSAYLPSPGETTEAAPGASPPETGLRDLSWALSGTMPTTPPPNILVRDDGVGLFYEARVNGIFGDPETAKSWLAMVAIVQVLAEGRQAAYIDVDHNGEAEVVSRLLALGAEVKHVADQESFRLYEPDDAAGLLGAGREIVAWAPAVVVVDSLGEIIPMLNMSSKDNDEITRALRYLIKPMAHEAGACVICIDHLPKGDARQSGFAIGGTAKKRSVDGSYLRAEVRSTFAPGKLGRASLFIEKDRTGGLRQATAGGYAGTFVLDSRNETMAWAIETKETEIGLGGSGPVARPTSIMEQISMFLEQWEDELPPSKTELAKVVKAGKDVATRALVVLEREGYLRVDVGKNSRSAHRLIKIKPYRQALDPRSDVFAGTYDLAPFLGE